MKMNSLQKINKFLIELFFTFSWFESFAIVNIKSIDWGFQFSWFVLLLFAIINFFSYFIYFPKINITELNVRKLFLVFLLITIIDLCYLFLNTNVIITWDNKYGIITSKFNTSKLFSRSLIHTCYILFLSIGCIIVFNYFKQFDYKMITKIVSKYLITIPFFFICIWGVYQWLSTYNLFPYIKIFNNNISTGFTYLRFKDLHRCSSVFPEPSEYAYFLGFYLPICLSFILTNKNVFCIKQNKFNKLVITITYLLQCYMCRSFSLFIIFPVLLFVSINLLNISKNIRRIINFFYVFLVFIIILLIFKLFGDRVNEILSGKDGSMLVRLSVMFDGFVLFMNRKLLGFGYGCIRGMDLISTTLGFFGFFGIVSLFVFIIKLYKKARKDFYTSVLSVSYICFLLVGCICNPVFEFVPFWLFPIIIELILYVKRRYI